MSASSTSMPRSYREGLEILLVTGDESVSQQWIEWLGRTTPGAVVSIASTVEEAHQAALEHPPHLLLLHAIKKEECINLVSDLHTAQPNLSVLILNEMPGRLSARKWPAAAWVDELMLPCSESEFHEAVHLLQRRMGSGAHSKFEAHLHDLRILDIIQIKCIQASTCMLVCSSPSEPDGWIWIEKGQIRYVAAGDMNGLDALAMLLSWRVGKITEKPFEAYPRQAVIKSDWQSVLMEAARKVDEAYHPGRPSEFAGVLDCPHHGMEKTRRVLVADDSPLILAFVQAVIARDFPEVEVIAIDSGDAVVESVIAYQPEVVVLDYFMPGITGEEICQDLLGDTRSSQIPVIMISGQVANLGNLQQHFSNIKAFLAKPFFPPQLVQQLKRWLGHTTRPAESPQRS